MTRIETFCWLPRAAADWIAEYDGPACARKTAIHRHNNRTIDMVPLVPADIAEARIAELEAEVKRLKDALALAVGLGQDLGMTEMEIDAIYAPAALTARPGQSADRPDR